MKLQTLLERSKNIAITTHYPLDHDAISSALLLKSFINKLYPDKNVDCISKEDISQKFSEYEYVNAKDFKYEFDIDSYDLIILVDVAEIERCLNVRFEDINAEVLIIDHHQTEGKPKCTLFVQDIVSSSVELVYSEFLKIDQNLKVTPTEAQLIQLGIVADTARFLYLTTPVTFRIFWQMNQIKPIDISETWITIDKITKNSLFVLKEILDNLKYVDRFAYSYITREFRDAHPEYGDVDISNASSIFYKQLGESVQGIDLVILIRPRRNSGEEWAISFKSKKGTVDVSKLARRFGGGGHENIAGAFIPGEDIDDVIQQILIAV